MSDCPRCGNDPEDCDGDCEETGRFPAMTDRPPVSGEPHTALDTLTGDAGDREWVNGHLYVHVAACPCPPMQAEVARLAEQEGE